MVASLVEVSEPDAAFFAGLDAEGSIVASTVWTVGAETVSVAGGGAVFWGAECLAGLSVGSLEAVWEACAAAS
ncbi:hypothetical protein [Gluconacetobacter tumulicola]|uniref:Uncharacterized protein n=1 Tax=Gluconacetobacter tumulicola TaxID=1017177 RepID=A0A7W4P8D9_9PROT|nr:hypothetical protein [Gluconacetobacter tumulicola]